MLGGKRRLTGDTRRKGRRVFAAALCKQGVEPEESLLKSKLEVLSCYANCEGMYIVKSLREIGEQQKLKNKIK